eukprot:1317631-Amphidinium_carterae.1
MAQAVFVGGGTGRHPLGTSTGMSEGHKLMVLRQLAPQFSPTQYRTLLAVSKKTAQCFLKFKTENGANCLWKGSRRR